jgi:hypothetical protein
MAKLQYTKLLGASFHQATLAKANCYQADFSNANFCRTDLYETDLQKATLVGANLQGVQLAGTNCKGARFEGCTVYGLSAWGLELDGDTIQKRFRIRYESGAEELEVEADDIEVAQFLYLLLNNEKIRRTIDTITSKVVLILGRFTPERKAVLDGLRYELRKPERNYVPIVFDFDKPAGRDITETVSLLAGMARFVVADITDAKSIPQELGVIVPDLPSVPVQPLLLEGSDEYSMFDHWRHFPWVLELYRYRSQEQLIADLDEGVIRPAEAKVLELRHPQPR